MTLITGFRAYVFNSSTAAVKLAIENPQKYFSFAEKLLVAKNQSNQRAMNKAQAAFNSVKLSVSEQIEARRGAPGLSAGAAKSAAELADRFRDHLAAKSVINGLHNKQIRYEGLANELARAGGKSLGLESQIKTEEFWENARPVKTVSWADQQGPSRARELTSVGNWKR